MKFPPVFTITPSITKLLYDLDVLRAGYALHPISEEQAIHLRRVSLLKSSLYSARIEGNPLDLSDVETYHEGDADRHKTEIRNLVSSYEQVQEIIGERITVDQLKKLHGNVLYLLSSDAGKLRQEESAIYNQSGTAVYLTPTPQDVRILLDAFCDYMNGSKDAAPVVAGVAHIWFEKIHPFLDGNGRVGRLLSAYILKKSGYDFSGLVPFEQYLEQHRDDYYYFLGQDRQDVTSFVEFYLTALLAQANISLSTVHDTGKPDTYAHLSLRRAEIMHLIEDHKLITFDFLARRFRAVPPRTLHFDLFQLAKDGLVQKKGTTRGVTYTLKQK